MLARMLGMYRLSRRIFDSSSGQLLYQASGTASFETILNESSVKFTPSSEAAKFPSKPLPSFSDGDMIALYSESGKLIPQDSPLVEIPFTRQYLYSENHQQKNQEEGDDVNNSTVASPALLLRLWFIDACESSSSSSQGSSIYHVRWFHDSELEFKAQATIEEKDRSTVHSKTAEHLCGDDLYMGKFTFQDQDAKQFQLQYVVQGPQKNMTIVSEFEKL